MMVAHIVRGLLLLFMFSTMFMFMLFLFRRSFWVIHLKLQELHYRCGNAIEMQSLKRKQAPKTRGWLICRERKWQQWNSTKRDGCRENSPGAVFPLAVGNARCTALGNMTHLPQREQSGWLKNTGTQRRWKTAWNRSR